MADITLTQGTNYYDSKTGANLGTVQYDPNTGAKLATGATTTQNIPTPEAPTNTADVTQTGNITIPTANYSVGNISNATAANSAAQTYIDTQQQITKDRQAQVQAEQDALAKQTKPLLDKILGSKSPSQVRTEAQAQTGINPADYFAEQKAQISEINSLTEDYNSAKGAMDAAIAKTYDKLGSNAFISNQQAAITRNAAPVLNTLSANINAKAALLQALQGNFQEASNFVNQAVQDATAEQNYNMNMYQTFYQINKDAIDALDKPYADAYKSAMDEATTLYNQATQDKTNVGNLMIQYPKAGIQITDTIDEATKKAAAAAAIVAKNVSPTAPTTYQIKGGDTLYNIAQSKGITLAALQAVNPSVDQNNLRPGQIINLPTSSSTSNTSISSTALTQFINQQMATPEFKALSNSQKKDYILSQGGNPSDFGF